MLTKHYTAVLTLAILVTLGITPKSVASSDKVKPYSSLEDQLTTLKEDISVSDSNLTINSEHIYGYKNNSKETILAQDVSPTASSNGTSKDENQSIKLWWLAPLIILVPFLGFLLLKSGSKPKQVDEEQTTSENLTDTVGVSSPTSQNATSEFAVDSSVTDKLTQEDAKVEEIDNISIETGIDSKVSDDIQEQVENATIDSSEAIQIQSKSYTQESDLEDNQSLENLNFPESLIEAEEIISEPLATSRSELEAPNVDNQNLESISVEEFTVPEEIAQSQPDLLAVPEEIAQSQPDLLAETDEMSAEIAPEQIEQITDQDLANISEWLNEKIDPDNKDVSVMDDFWDNLSSITEEISAETAPEQIEKITDQELANISEWLNEKVNPDSHLSDIANNSVDNLPDIVGGKDQDSNEKLLDNSLNLEEEQNQNTKTKEGISDSTSSFLEELLNEDSSQEHKH